MDHQTQERRVAPWSALGAALVALATVAAAPAHAQSEGALTEGEQELVDAYTVMQGVTAGLIGTTAALGAMQLYNMPTAFGDGGCADGSAIGGEFACSRHLTLVHGALGVLSIGSYTATGILALEAPDLDQARGEDTVTDVLGTATAVGLGLTGLMGILGANPWLLGIHESDQDDFSRVVRVIHAVLALTTASVFASHILVDHID